MKRHSAVIPKHRLAAAGVAGLCWVVAAELVLLSMQTEEVEAEQTGTRGQLLLAAAGALAFGVAVLFLADWFTARRRSSG